MVFEDDIFPGMHFCIRFSHKALKGYYLIEIYIGSFIYDGYDYFLMFYF